MRCIDCQRIRVRWRSATLDLCRRCHFARIPVTVRYITPEGRNVRVSGRWMAKKQGSIKRAYDLWATGKAHRYTSEESRALQLHLWATKWKMNKRIGRRLGRSSITKTSGMNRAK